MSQRSEERSPLRVLAVGALLAALSVPLSAWAQAPEAKASAQIAATALTAPSHWRNDRGSELKILSLDAQGRFKGEYLNKAPGFGCRDTPFDVTGGITGDEVRFLVLWKNATESCNSMTVWRGRLSGDTLATEWELARTDEKTGGIAILRGSSTFSIVR